MQFLIYTLASYNSSPSTHSQIIPFWLLAHHSSGLTSDLHVVKSKGYFQFSYFLTSQQHLTLGHGLLFETLSPHGFHDQYSEFAPFLSSWAWRPHCLWGCPLLPALENPMRSHQSPGVFPLSLSPKGAHTLPTECRKPPPWPAYRWLQGHRGSKPRGPRLLTWDQLLESAGLGVAVIGKERESRS